MEREREQLKSIIDEWNVNRLDLFELSQPNEELEFHGVMRFYFQDAGQKIATKCIRVSSTACSQDVINILIEKFRPDIRMLSIPEYALYETYENGEERKLAEEEKPLLVQLNWHHDDREGRFLLRRMDEKSFLPGFDPAQSNFKRKLSKREKKEKRKAEKEQMRMQNKQQQSSGSRENDTKVSEKLYTEVPENSFTRSISNPEAVMRRRRKQKLEKKLQQFCQEGGLDAGGTLRIFGETLNPDVPYKTLLLSTQDTAQYVVREILDKYGKEKEEHNNYCLVQLIVPHEQQMANGGTAPLSDHNGNPAIREYILDDDDCPLAIEKQHQRVRGSLSFHIRRRPADYQPRKKKKKPLHLKPEFEVNSEEILQRLHSLNPTTNNHPHNHPHLLHHPHLSSNNNHNGSNQMQQQQQQQMGAGADSGITSSGLSGREQQQQLLGEMPVVQKYMNDSERSSTNSQNNSQHFTPHTESDPSVTPHSPAAAAALLPNHPASQLSVTDSGGHFFPNSDSQLHHQQLLQHQQRDRRSGSDQGHDSGSAGIPGMNGVAPAAAGQLLAKRQNTGPDTDVIIFKKGGGGMGLSIVATQGLGQQKLGIYIKNVVPGGAADEDGRLQAGDQLLAVDGNSLIGVTQEQAAELISKTGPQVTLEVARNAAAYYGLANLLNQPSPQVTRHPRIMSHSQSYANQPQAQRQTPQQQQQHYLSQQFLPQSATLPAGMTHPGHGLQQQPPSYANAPIASSVVPGSHLMQQAQLVPAMPSLLQSQSSLIQEERHYQNISMYRQPQPPLPNPPNGLPSSSSVRALNNAYAHPPHHNSYSSLHALHAASNPQQQINSATLPGRPMSTVYPNNMMGRVSSMAQYPTYAGPSSQMQAAQQQQIYRSGHTGSVPALHPSHNQWSRDGYAAHLYPQGNGTIPGISQMNQQSLYGRNGAPVAGASMLPPPSRVSIVSTKGLIDGEQPPTGYRYVPSAYPTKSMDSLNNNNNMMMNGHNNNNNNMNQQLWRRNKNNSSSGGNSAQEFNAQIEEQEERLRLLKLEEMKRHHELEVEQIQIAEERLLKEAKTRRGQDEDGAIGKTSRAYQEQPAEILPPLPKSPPPLDPVVPLMSQQPSSRPETTRVAFRNHLMQASASQDEGRQPAYPSSVLRVNGDINGGHPAQSAAPVVAKKAVSWNDTPAHPAVATQLPADVLTNGMASAGNSTSGITLEDIDEVLGSSTEQDEPSALVPNTPNVIGSQEVYRDPRERMIQEKLKNKQKVASQGPEQLSFKEKMQMFAMEQSGAASAGKSALKSATRVIAENANSIPEEES